MTLEVIIPLRNPGDVLDQTIRSLTAQTDRNFSVLLSDNFSTAGFEQFARAEALLSQSGIAVRTIRPPIELERVEHWNWAHYQSTGDWLKPLFAGDWLDSAYVARVREMAANDSNCRYIFANCVYHRPGQPDLVGTDVRAGGFRPPLAMQDLVLRCGMQFGPPSAAAYERTAFISLGGYPTTLPITADSLLFCTLAARFGAASLPEALCHFQLHAGRFSIDLPGKRRATLREHITYYSMLAYHAWTERDAFPVRGFLRLLARLGRDSLLRK